VRVPFSFALAVESVVEVGLLDLGQGSVSGFEGVQLLELILATLLALFLELQSLAIEVV
jgi:hypothetical protein